MEPGTYADLQHPAATDTSGQSGLDADDRVAIEPFGPGQQCPAYALARIVLVATVAERFVLHATAHVINRGAGELDEVEAVSDQLSIGEPDRRVGDCRAVAAVRIESHRGDLFASGRALPFEPACDRGGMRPTTTSITRFRIRSTEHGHVATAGV